MTQRSTIRSSSCAVIAVAACVLITPQAFAYVDPNAASAFYQWLMPLTILIVSGWRWIKMTVSAAIARIKNLF
jgi:hypothetical protein